VTPERSHFSLLSLLSVTHVEWMVNGGVFIPLSLTLIFPCGTNEIIPGFISDLSDQWTLSFSLSLSPFLCLSSTIDIYFYLLSCLSLRFSKGKQSNLKFLDSLSNSLNILLIFLHLRDSAE
jgi:hypothetical protein